MSVLPFLPLQRFAIATTALACIGGAGAVELKYVMWDASQLPGYRQCARDFSAKHPGTTVKIRQMGWGDYWMAVSTSFIAGAPPDVFVNHLSYFPQFVQNDLLLDLAPLIRRDKLDLGIYVAGLAEAWGRGGHQYGLPKDWDTVGLIVNLAQARKAGVSLAELRSMTWNPQDGGSLEQVMRKLTRDAQGRSLNDPGFDAKQVAIYGYQNSRSGGMAGQVEWSHFAVSSGFKFQDAPWSAHYHYDDPRLAQTLDWLAGLPAKGVSARYEAAKGLGADGMFVAGKAAMVAQGSWMIGYFAGAAKFETAWVPLPKGPGGQRASMLNGLADSIAAASPHREEAWQWVRYLASADCQAVIAARGVVFPAIKGMAEQALAVHRAKGIDASAFLEMAQSQTFPSPISDSAAEVNELIGNAIESVLLGQTKAGPALAAANAKVRKRLAPLESPH